MEATGYVTDAEKNDGSIIWTGEDWEKTDGINWRFDAAGNPHTEDESNQPVTHLSWNDASAYAEWVGKRLPTDGRMPRDNWQIASVSTVEKTQPSLAADRLFDERATIFEDVTQKGGQ